MGIRKKLYYTWYGRCCLSCVKYLISRDFFHRKLRIQNKGSLRMKKSVIGHHNHMVIGENACMDRVILNIKGSNNRITIGNNTVLGKGCRIYMFGDNLELIIGENCTFNHDDELLVQEDNSKIHIGNDCMFSHHINVRTSDAHPIYFESSKERANPAKNVYIGNHVWIGANVIIQKGSKIGDGCVVATNSIVNHRINPKYDEVLPTNTIFAGMPAKSVKDGIQWERAFD